MEKMDIEGSTQTLVSGAEVDPGTILNFLRDQGPASLVELHGRFPNVQKQALVDFLNVLTTQGQAELLKNRAGALRWQAAASAETLEKVKGMTAEERVVYQLIEKEGNMGLWTRDLRFKSGFQQTQVNKALKSLETRKLIKAVKSIAGRNRKVYMLYDLEPSVKVKGNAFYSSDGLFDSEFVAVLNQHCYLHIEQKGSVTLEELASFVRGSGISNVELKDDDVQQVLNTLIYDGKIDKVKDAGISVPGRPSYVYKPSRVPLPLNGLTSVPCGQCPVRSIPRSWGLTRADNATAQVYYMCEDEGDVTPVKCPYLTQWLDTKW